MTTYLDKELLLSTLRDRIANLNATPQRPQHPAVTLNDLYVEIANDEYDVQEADALTAEQDPLDAAADRIIAGNVAKTVQQLTVGDVGPVGVILAQREREAGTLIEEIGRAREVYAKAVREAVEPRTVEADSEEMRVQDDLARMEREGTMRGESIAWRGDYTTRNGGR